MFSLTVQLAGNGGGRIVSTPAGIDCPASCNATFAAGTTVSLTATAELLARFAGFGGGCSGSSCTISPTADLTLSATFELRRYAVINLGRVPNAGGFCSPTAISPGGAYVAGVFGRGNGSFLWDGAMHDIGVETAFARAVNDSGAVAGDYRINNGAHAFRWRAGVMTDLGTLGGTGSGAMGMNRNGIVVGQAARTDGQPRAVYWNAAGITDLGSLGSGRSACSSASGINSDGIIVGSSCRDSAGAHAVRFRNPGVIDDLGVLGGTSSSAAAI